MEVVEVCTQKRCNPQQQRPPTPSHPTKVQQCSRKYVQPPRAASCAPKKLYRTPSATFTANTTYHTSYLNRGECERPRAFRPSPKLEKAHGKFDDTTTSGLSYRPVWDVVKARPFVPLRRKLSLQGPMQSTTTARADFGPKYVEKPDVVIPCGNIRACKGPLDGQTTSGVSFVHPGFCEPPKSFKPAKVYQQPEEPTSSETTHKLSFLPFAVPPREKYSWAEKQSYKSPEASMDGHTTYSESYIQTGQPQKQKPILPASNTDWLQGNREFNSKSCYSEAYVPQVTEVVVPVVPCSNISLSSDKKMASDTTNKLSYRPVRAEKRSPIRPRRRKVMEGGPMQSMTTSKSDFQAKSVPRPEIIIPCDNIGHSKQPLECLSTSAVSYTNYGVILRPQSFKPSIEYSKPTSKLEGDTVNKLSYRAWSPLARETPTWNVRRQYEPPKEKMTGDSIYNTTFGPPGYYIEECETDCPAKQSDVHCRPQQIHEIR